MAEEFDPCECVNLLTQEQRMQRLINMVGIGTDGRTPATPPPVTDHHLIHGSVTPVRAVDAVRDSQTVCNDNECFNDVMSGPSTAGVLTPGDEGTQLSLMTVMIGWIVLVMILYLLRPNSWRRRSHTKK
ncbi:unnamed protein product, partial [Medioppia subpectinata]